jgi:hypothetical protein
LSGRNKGGREDSNTNHCRDCVNPTVRQEGQGRAKEVEEEGASRPEQNRHPSSYLYSASSVTL